MVVMVAEAMNLLTLDGLSGVRKLSINRILANDIITHFSVSDVHISNFVHNFLHIMQSGVQ